jgi:hypothetical protein
MLPEIVRVIVLTGARCCDESSVSQTYPRHPRNQILLQLAFVVAGSEANTVSSLVDSSGPHRGLVSQAVDAPLSRTSDAHRVADPRAKVCDSAQSER